MGRRLSPRRFKRFVTQHFHLGSYLRRPGDGRLRPQIPASTLLWALLIGQVLREWSFAAIEALVRSPARRSLAVARAFGDDTLGYFTERLQPQRTRQALADVLKQAVESRFREQAPNQVFMAHGDRIEVWDADDFDPWATLRWTSVRVLRYRQHRPDGRVIEADWLTNAPQPRVGSQALYRMAKSRWQVENQGFNDAKNRHGLEHLCHHHANSLLVGWLLILLALCLERLYRLRYLHRGAHPVLTAIQLVRALRLSLGASPRLRPINSS